MAGCLPTIHKTLDSSPKSITKKKKKKSASNTSRLFFSVIY